MPRLRVSPPHRTSSTSTVRLFVISAYVLFFCLLAANLIPTSPYSIEKYNMRDYRTINGNDYESCILAIKKIKKSTEMNT